MTNTPITTTPPTIAIEFFPVDAVRMWDNARNQFSQQELADLARTIRETEGVLQMPIGYEVDEDPIAVELVAGERRWRAYKLLRDQGHAEYAQVPVRLIRRPSEREAYKWSLIENVQRENLKPSELGDWLAKMLELEDEATGRPVWTLASLGEEIGKSNGYVSQLLTSRRAPESVRRLVDEGKCPLKIATMIGGLPGSMREGAAAEMVTGPLGVMGEVQAQAWMAEHYRRDLRHADFDKEAIGLAGAPACVKCEWWGGNRDDVAGKNAVHVCLNPICYRSKQIAAAATQAEGPTMVLDDAEAARLWEPHTGLLSPESGYIDVTERPSPTVLADVARSAGAVVPTWGEVLRGAGLDTAVAAFAPNGARHLLVETGEALRVAASSRWGQLFKEGAVAGYLSPEEKSAERQAKAAGDKEFRAMVGEGLCELVRGFSAAEQPVLTHAIRAAVEDLCKGDDLALLAEVLGVSGRDQGIGEAIDAWLKGQATYDGLVSALVAVLLVRRVRYEGFAPLVQDEGAPLAELCALANFDAADWNKRAKRKRQAAEMHAREAAMQKAKEKAGKAIEGRRTKGE